jgi:hypothetical protein
MKERREAVLKKILSFSFLSLSKKKKLTNFVCLFFFCFLFFCNKRLKNIKFSLPFLATTFSSHLVFCIITQIIKRKRTKTPKERERERERAADAWKRRKSFAFGHK